jgi:hypothetical protein
MSAEPIKGMAELQRKIAGLGARGIQEAGRALYQEVGIIVPEMKRRCPVAPDGGTLRGTIEEHPAEIRDGAVTVSVSAGGPAIDYAVAVHEHLSEHSPPSWRAAGQDGIHWNAEGTGPKFMEGPQLEVRDSLAEHVGRRMDANALVK